MVKVLVTGGRRKLFRLVISTYILVIGSGFVGVPTIKQLIANDHTVEATVRSEAKAVQTKAVLTPEEASKTTFRIIPDVTPDGAFDELINTGSYDAVVHTAGPFHYSLRVPGSFVPSIGTQETIAINHRTCWTLTSKG